MTTITVLLLCLRMLAMDYGITSTTVHATTWQVTPTERHTVLYMTDTPGDVDASCTVSLDMSNGQLDTHECVDSKQ